MSEPEPSTPTGPDAVNLPASASTDVSPVEAAPRDSHSVPGEAGIGTPQRSGADAKDTHNRLQTQMDEEDLAKVRNAYSRVAQRGQTLSDCVAGIIVERIHRYRNEVNNGPPFQGAGQVMRGRPPSTEVPSSGIRRPGDEARSHRKR